LSYDICSFYAALATAFVKRLGSKYDRFKKLGRKNRTIFSRILISLNSWEELEEDQKYKVKLLGLLPTGVAISPAAKAWMTAVDALLESVLEGLEAELTEVESESDVAISTLREFKPIDFDFLSFATGEFDLTADG
jgi:hypothetical protein